MQVQIEGRREGGMEPPEKKQEVPGQHLWGLA